MIQFPDGELHVTDDAKVKLVLMELGLINWFKHPPDPRPTVFIYTVDDHPTHWLLFASFRGYPDNADNGLMMQAWPKSRVSRAQADQFTKTFAQMHGVTVERRDSYPGGVTGDRSAESN